MLPDKSSGPRVGPEPLQPLRHGGARQRALLERILMRLAVASGHARRLMSIIASTGQHCAANSLPDHRPTSVDRRQLTGTVPPAPRMASVRGPFDHFVRSDGMEDKNGARRPHVCCSGQQDPGTTPLPPRSTVSARPMRRGGRHTSGALFLFLFFLFPSLGLWYPVISPWSIKEKAEHRSERDRSTDRSSSRNIVLSNHRDLGAHSSLVSL